MALTVPLPFHNSDTSTDVDGINYISTAERLSLACPMMVVKDFEPPTFIAPTIAVIIPKGAVAKMILSVMPMDWLMNWFGTCSKNRAINSLIILH